MVGSIVAYGNVVSGAYGQYSLVEIISAAKLPRLERTSRPNGKLTVFFPGD